MQTLSFNNHEHKHIFDMMMKDSEWIDYLTKRLISRGNSENPLEVFASVFKKVFRQYRSFDVRFERYTIFGKIELDILSTQGIITGSGPDLTNFKLRYL